MRAVVCTRYGPPEVLRLEERAKPAPGDNEVLIRTRASTVSSGDHRVRSLDLPRGFKTIGRLILGLTKPRQPVLGTELAGEVEAVGRGVTKFRPGDPVFAFSGAKMGCHAEYKCMPEDGAVAAKPAKLSFDEAATLSFGGTTALDFLRRARLKKGETVLVNGASGAVGTATVQLAKHFGATVTGVCSGANLALVKSLGADHVIDYTKEEFTQNGIAYDVIVDTAGTAPYARSKASLKKGGRLLVVLGGLSDMLLAPWVSMVGDKKVIAGPAAERPEDLRLLAKLAEEGEYRPVVDRCYPFEQIVEAHRYVDTGRKKGNVVVTLGHSRDG